MIPGFLLAFGAQVSAVPMVPSEAAPWIAAASPVSVYNDAADAASVEWTDAAGPHVVRVDAGGRATLLMPAGMVDLGVSLGIHGRARRAFRMVDGTPSVVVVSGGGDVHWQQLTTY